MDSLGEVARHKGGCPSRRSVQLNYDLLKKDIEDRYEELHQRKVELISHSLGSVVLCYFLNKVVDQGWKDKYIGSFTMVAPATGGSFKAIKSLLSGYALLTAWLNSLQLACIRAVETRAIPCLDQVVRIDCSLKRLPRRRHQFAGEHW